VVVFGNLVEFVRMDFVGRPGVRAFVALPAPVGVVIGLAAIEYAAGRVALRAGFHCISKTTDVVGVSKSSTA